MELLYQSRIDRVIDYIQANLDENLTVEQLAKLACFSEFHFNRIFKQRVGQNAYQFVRRLRVEKAARLLIFESRAITDIALSCGFSNSASFAKSFKQVFGKSATQWRDDYLNRIDSDRDPVHLLITREPLSTVVIEQMPALRVAYVRNIGNFISNGQLFESLYGRLMQWAQPRQIALSPSYHLYHDSPFITDKSQLRVMVAIPIEEGIKPSGDVSATTLSGGLYAVRNFYLTETEFSYAWDWMVSVWLPKSGYQMDNEREAIERCNVPVEHEGQRFFHVDLCVPIIAAK
ncbi:AraC family transcriptional regulator [Vibrio nigripulchritudo ATCC 27043]|uniref:AraC family transcriptional regulator n=1 Tax=Vibrio nigripulchritudo TaxID=28173 RepID=UPI00021C25EC|nr:AraC family transcriptional regulator [Vibrio nigripulchritudo]EGU61595.1 AraC family transcriptional regulator [Vibrio nigripulchritudo ATCC 27043]